MSDTTHHVHLTYMYMSTHVCEHSHAHLMYLVLKEICITSNAPEWLGLLMLQVVLFFLVTYRLCSVYKKMDTQLTLRLASKHNRATSFNHEMTTWDKV